MADVNTKIGGLGGPPRVSAPVSAWPAPAYVRPACCCSDCVARLSLGSSFGSLIRHSRSVFGESLTQRAPCSVGGCRRHAADAVQPARGAASVDRGRGPAEARRQRRRHVRQLGSGSCPGLHGPDEDVRSTDAPSRALAAPVPLPFCSLLHDCTTLSAVLPLAVTHVHVCTVLRPCLLVPLTSCFAMSYVVGCTSGTRPGGCSACATVRPRRAARSPPSRPAWTSRSSARIASSGTPAALWVTTRVQVSSLNQQTLAIHTQPRSC